MRFITKNFTTSEKQKLLARRLLWEIHRNVSGARKKKEKRIEGAMHEEKKMTMTIRN
jgi:hypothetical protein